VDAGVPFCPECGAAQIKVSLSGEIRPERRPATPPLVPGTPGEVQPPAEPIEVEGGAQRFRAAPSIAAIDWTQALSAAVISGLVLALAWSLPVLGAFLWMLAAGVLSVALYRRRYPEGEFTSGMGAKVGALAGLFGFILFSLFSAMAMLLFRQGGRLRQIMFQAMEQSAARNPDPRVHEMLQRLMSPEGMAVMIALGMGMFLVGFVLCCSLGGAIGASLFRKRENR